MCCFCFVLLSMLCARYTYSLHNRKTVEYILLQDPAKAGMKELKKAMILQQRKQDAEASKMLAAAAADPVTMSLLKVINQEGNAGRQGRKARQKGCEE
jgi:hypothetical protein